VPRTLTIAARRAIYAPETGEVFLVLLTITHPSLPAPIRVVANSEDIVSEGLTYQRFPFEVTLPPESEDSPPSVKLRIANADREIVRAVRSVSGEAMKAELRVVLASSPDVIEAGPYEFTIRQPTFDASFVEATLRFEEILSEPYPADAFTPSRFPGLF
jgi:hypothetical protein